MTYHFADAMAEVDRVAEDEGLKTSIRRYAIEVGAIEERVYRKEMEVPIEDMKRFLDGIYISTMRGAQRYLWATYSG